MSDLEATSARGSSAAPISNLAIGKLRALGGHGPALAQADGLIDAFAEVFARIAASQPVLSQDTAADDGGASTVTNEKPAQSDERDTSDTGSADVSSEDDINAEQILVELEPDSAVVVVDSGPIQEDSLSDEADESAELVLVDETVVQEIDVAAVEVQHLENHNEEVETPDLVAHEVVEEDESGNRRRDRRDATTIAPVEKESGRGRTDGDKTPTEVRDDGKELATEIDQTFDGAPDQEGNHSSRRVRRGSRRRASEQEGQTPVSQTQQARSRPQPEAIGVASTSDESLANQTIRPEAGRTRPAARNVEASVTQLQNIASSVIRNTAASGAQGGTQTGLRGSTQAIESTDSLRDPAKPKADSGASKHNTADTVSRVKLIQRVSKAFQHLGPEGGVVRLRLAPAEMGSVRVEMRINQRKVQARVVAESEAASAALREHLPELRQRLESQGMQIERLEIETEQGETDLGRRQDHRGSGDSAGADRQWEWRQSSSGSATNRVSPTVSQPSPAPAAHNLAPSTGGVDVRF